MPARVAGLTRGTIATAPSVCRDCVWWQSRGNKTASKERWIERVEEESGEWGTIYYDDDGSVLGSMQYGPSGFFPRAADLPAGPPSDDAVLVTCAYLTREGVEWVEKSLFLAAIGEARDQGAKALEAFAYRYPDRERALDRSSSTERCSRATSWRSSASSRSGRRGGSSCAGSSCPASHPSRRAGARRCSASCRRRSCRRALRTGPGAGRRGLSQRQGDEPASLNDLPRDREETPVVTPGTEREPEDAVTVSLLRTTLPATRAAGWGSGSCRRCRRRTTGCPAAARSARSRDRVPARTTSAFARDKQRPERCVASRRSRVGRSCIGGGASTRACSGSGARRGLPRATATGATPCRNRRPCRSSSCSTITCQAPRE